MNSSNSDTDIDIIESSSSSSGSDSDDEFELARNIQSESSSDSDSDDDDTLSTSSITRRPRKKAHLVYSKKGVLLQHRLNLEGDTRKRIAATGFKMNENFFTFTQKEDGIIRENWEKFAKYQKFEGGIFEFMGFDKDGLQVTNKPNLVPTGVLMFQMWPMLCKGLDNRFAKMVRKRISYIFHPYFKEDEDYDMDEVQRRYDEGESMLDVSEALKIPPRWLERHLKQQKRAEPYKAKVLEKDSRTTTLRLLFETVIESDDHHFCMKNIDWKLFREKCREKEIVLPEPRAISETFRRQFNKLEKDIFRHLTPAPTLKNKILYVREAMIRYNILPTNNKRRTGLPVIRMDTLFTIIFEDYNKNQVWNPPSELDFYAKQVDLEKIRERIQNVKEKRKRMSSAPRAKISVVVTKRLKLEDLDGSANSSIRNTTGNELEISSIQGESSSASSVFDQPDLPEEEEPEEDLTEFEISSINNTSSVLQAKKDETILAAGGNGILQDSNDTSTLGGGEETLQNRRDKKQDTVELDMSQDIWSQLVS